MTYALTKENDIVLTSAHMAFVQVLMGEALAIHQPCRCVVETRVCVESLQFGFLVNLFLLSVEEGQICHFHG